MTMFHYLTHSLDVSYSVLVSSLNLEILGPEFTFLCSNHLDLRSFHHEIFKVINPCNPHALWSSVFSQVLLSLVSNATLK